MAQQLTHKALVEALHYDPETGIFRWASARGKFSIGQLAGGTGSNGYIYITVLGKKYLAHRLAWFFVHMRWPINQIDHRNRKRSDNRICNLREATCSQNLANGRGWSGALMKGVTFVPRLVSKPFLAQASQTVEGRHVTHFLGYFKTAEEAHEAYMKKANELHGEFASS